MTTTHPIALVTGCRSGFGLAISVALARAGYKVYAGLRDPATGAALARAAEGLAIVPVALDVTVAAERERVV
ncbi:MAG: SDR family NAD(P)-dependent oxidoreductase, partial [Myxococcota bacterium]